METYRKTRRLKLVDHACHSMMKSEWHWFKHHFSHLPLHPFAREMIEAILDCDEHISGFDEQFLESVLAIRNKEKFLDHYDQLMQRMAELLVIRRSLLIDLKNPRYLIEPTAGESKKRPDLVIEADDAKIVIEIKAPSCIKQKSLRKTDTVQLLARLPGDPGKLAERIGLEVVLPRDNAVKDFLISADEKFSSFKSDADCFTLLIIVWDDFMQEVITALTHEESGLLTEGSFARGSDGRPIKYQNIDAIVVIRHLPYFMSGAGDGDLLDRKHAFDFGDSTALPNIFIPNPESRKPIPDSIAEVFRAYPLNDGLISKMAEYQAQEMVFWIPLLPFDGSEPRMSVNGKIAD